MDESANTSIPFRTAGIAYIGGSVALPPCNCLLYLTLKRPEVFGTTNVFNERRIHLIFDISLWFKGAFALAEIAGGIAIYFISQQFMLAIALWVTQEEFAEDPHDLIANSLLHAVQNFSVSTQHFAAIYLLAHGIIKLWLITGLLRQRLWYYPVAMMVFTAFIAYQLYRFTYTHSMWLVLITVLDTVVIVLTWHEYRFLTATNGYLVRGDKS